MELKNLVYRPKTIATLSSETEEIVALANSLSKGFQVNLDEVDAWTADKVLVLEQLQAQKADEDAKKNASKNRGRR